MPEASMKTSGENFGGSYTHACKSESHWHHFFPLKIQ